MLEQCQLPSSAFWSSWVSNSLFPIPVFAVMVISVIWGTMGDFHSLSAKVQSSCEVQNTHQLSCCWLDFWKSEHYQRPPLVCLLCTLWSVLWLTEPHWPMRPSPLLDNELAASPKLLMPFMIYPSHPSSPFSNQWPPSRYYILVCIFHKFIFMQLYYMGFFFGIAPCIQHNYFEIHPWHCMY